MSFLTGGQKLPEGFFQGVPKRLLIDCVRAFRKEGSRKPKITGITSKSNACDRKTIQNDKNNRQNKGFEIKSYDRRNLSPSQSFIGELDEVLKGASHTLTVLEVFVQTNRSIEYIF